MFCGLDFRVIFGEYTGSSCWYLGAIVSYWHKQNFFWNCLLLLPHAGDTKNLKGKISKFCGEEWYLGDNQIQAIGIDNFVILMVITK